MEPEKKSCSVSGCSKIGFPWQVILTITTYKTHTSRVIPMSAVCPQHFRELAPDIRHLQQTVTDLLDMSIRARLGRVNKHDAVYHLLYTLGTMLANWSIIPSSGNTIEALINAANEDTEGA